MNDTSLLDNQNKGKTIVVNPSQKTLLLAFGLGLVAAFSSGIVILNFLEVYRLPTVSNLINRNNVPLPSSYPDKAIVRLPISLKDQSVLFAGASYTLEGSIYSFRKTDKSTDQEIILKSKGGNIFFDLPLKASSTTPVLGANNRKFVVSDLRVDDKVMINYYLDLRTNEGNVTVITLIPR